MVFRSDCGLFLGTRVQLIVFYTTINNRDINFFKLFLVLIADQLDIVGQYKKTDSSKSFLFCIF